MQAQAQRTTELEPRARAGLRVERVVLDLLLLVGRQERDAGGQSCGRPIQDERIGKGADANRERRRDEVVEPEVESAVEAANLDLVLGLRRVGIGCDRGVTEATDERVTAVKPKLD